MALGTTNISTDLVGTTLGTSSRDVGTLCNSPNINKWSKYKPIINGDSVQSTTGDTYNSGLIIKVDTLTTGTTLNYFVACNTTNILGLESLSGYTYEDIAPYIRFRLGDFRGYNHNAKKPSYDEIFPSLQVFPGEKENGNLIFTIQGDSLDVVRSILSTRNLFDEISYINRYAFAGEWFSYNQLIGLTYLTKTIEAYSLSGYDALFPFETTANQSIRYNTPYFLDYNYDTRKVYLDKNDALAGGQKTFTFNRELVVPELFNKYRPDGTRKGARFRDVPLEPVIYGISDLYVRSLRLYCQSETDISTGVPPHYTIHLNADGDFSGDYDIQVKFDVYTMDWQNKVIGTLTGQTTYTMSGLEPLVSNPDIPSTTPTVPYHSGIYGNNDVFIHLSFPLEIQNILLLDYGNPSIANYNLVDYRIKHYAIKAYIDFIPY